jgi:hypothetical protein
MAKIYNYNRMKKFILLLLVTVSLTAFGQFKDNGLNKPDVNEGIVNQSSGNVFGFLNSENFSMNHSFSMAYTSFGGQGFSLGSYTNSMFYKLMSNMNVQMDVSFMFSPYSSFGEAFQKDLSGVYISKAAVNYYPFKDVYISVQYRNMPYTGFYNSYFGLYDGFYGDPFYRSNFEKESSLLK